MPRYRGRVLSRGVSPLSVSSHPCTIRVGCPRTLIHQLEDDIVVGCISSRQFLPEIHKMVIRHRDGRVEKGHLGLSNDGAVPSSIVMLYRTPCMISQGS